MEKKNNSKFFAPRIISDILNSGGEGVLPTDTLYGIVGSALAKKTVERIYKLRKRNLSKPMIVLISSIRDLQLFDVAISKDEKKLLQKFWPGKVSVILQCKNKKFTYLHRGQKTIAFRLPENIYLKKLLKKIGPLVAPSANLEGEKSSETISEAKNYFAEKVDFYVDAGKLKSQPSTIVSLENGQVTILRKGAQKIS